MPNHSRRPRNAWPSRRLLGEVSLFHGLQGRHLGKFQLFFTALISTANNDHHVQCFRNNEYYKLMVQEKSSEPGHRGSSVSPSLHRGANRGFRHGSDAKAIFVGGLPEAVTEEQLRQVFLPYGNILDCKVVRKSLGGKFTLPQSIYIC
jgi:hypothetical protein